MLYKNAAGHVLKKTVTLTFIGILFCFLLLFPDLSFQASKNGLLLWFDTLLPTLLPFLVLSQLILKTPLIQYAETFIGPFFCKLFHCSPNGAFCVLCGFLCGYPVGARLIALQRKDQKLSIAEGQYLLSFCNQVSPAFCISYGIVSGIGTTEIIPFLCMIYGSSLLFAYFTRPKTFEQAFPKTKKQTRITENIFQLIDVCIIDSFLIMIKLCGYMILFSLISTGITLLIPARLSWCMPFITSLLEITNGLSKIHTLPYGIYRSALGVFALSFGGFCCIFQTSSVLSDSGLSLKKYILHKIITALIALFLFVLWNFFHGFTVNGWR